MINLLALVNDHLAAVLPPSIFHSSGKDSLSMAARFNEDTVKSPGSLVISTYAACDDITMTVTPDLKCPGGAGTCHCLYTSFRL